MAEFGYYWQTKGDEALYDIFFNGEKMEHSLFAKFVKEHNDFDSVYELGCGDGRSVSLYFQGKEYLGVDISGMAIDRAMKNYPFASFKAADFLKQPDHKADLVCALVTLDSVYDIDATLELMKRCATKYVFFTNHYARTKTDDHIIVPSEKNGTCQNQLSEKAIRVIFPDVVKLTNAWYVIV